MKNNKNRLPIKELKIIQVLKTSPKPLTFN
jgi:hypothetical protein